MYFPYAKAEEVKECNQQSRLRVYIQEREGNMGQQTAKWRVFKRACKVSLGVYKMLGLWLLRLITTVTRRTSHLGRQTHPAGHQRRIHQPLGSRGPGRQNANDLWVFIPHLRLDGVAYQRDRGSVGRFQSL